MTETTDEVRVVKTGFGGQTSSVSAVRLRRVPPEPPQADKRKLQGERSREEILDAASRMMSQKGFEGTSIADLGRESGLPNSSIYWHFSSKAGILAAVMERGARRFFLDAAATPPAGPSSPGEHLSRALTRAGVSVTEHGEFLRLLFLLMLSGAGDETQQVVARVRDEGRRTLHGLLRTAFQTTAGEATAAIVADELVDYALATFDGAFLASQADPPVDHAALMARLADSLAELGRRVVARESSRVDAVP